MRSGKDGNGSSTADWRRSARTEHGNASVERPRVLESWENITFERQYIVINADMTKYFDSIRKQLLMEPGDRRINDPRVIRLLWKWLDAWVMDDGQYFKADEYGTPQGAVISPLLANISLHSCDTMFQVSGIPGTLIRYADEFVIFLRGKGKPVLDWVRRTLKLLGVTLHPEKLG